MGRRYGLPALLGLTLLLAWGYPLRERMLSGENDFLQLYAGARLVGTPQLYDPEASYQITRQLTASGAHYPGIYYTRLPYYAWLLRPLGALPYRWAYTIFQVLSLTLVAAFLLLYIRQFPELMVLAAMSVPLLINFANGQDVGLTVALAGFSFYLAPRRPFLAGLLLSLCTIKFHLFLLVPVAVLLHRQWRYLAGALTGCASLFLLSTIAAGWDWPGQFAALLSRGELHTDLARMPAWRGFVAALTGGDSWAIEAPLGAATVLLFAFIAWKQCDFPVVLSLATIASLLVSHHAYAQDLLVVLLSAAVVGARRVSPRLRTALFLVALPPTVLLVFTGPPYSAAVPLLLLSILAASAADAYYGEKRPPRGDTTTGTGLRPGPAAHG